MLAVASLFWVRMQYLFVDDLDHSVLTATILSIAGAAIISLFYESVQKRLGSVGIHIAYGGISRGKTTAAKIALAVCCNLQKGYTISLSVSC